MKRPGLGRGALLGLATRWLSRRRFPTLLAIAAVLLGLDLVVPDVIPLADELLLALATLILGSWRKRSAGPDQPPPAAGSGRPV